MAYINDKVARHFRTGEHKSNDPNTTFYDLDLGLSNAADLVLIIRDQVLEPGDNGHERMDGIASALNALLAYLGQMGQWLDALEPALVSSDRRNNAADISL